MRYNTGGTPFRELFGQCFSEITPWLMCYFNIVLDADIPILEAMALNVLLVSAVKPLTNHMWFWNRRFMKGLREHFLCALLKYTSDHETIQDGTIFLYGAAGPTCSISLHMRHNGARGHRFHIVHDKGTDECIVSPVSGILRINDVAVHPAVFWEEIEKLEQRCIALLQ